MSKKAFKERERAFEAIYFARVDAELIEKMHKNQEDSSARGLLTSATGITDEALLQRILELGVDAKTFQALSLVPLVQVAWASGQLTREERRATLEAAEAHGVCADSGSRQLLDAWLEYPPVAPLVETWRKYIHAMFELLDEDARTQLKQDLLDRGEKIAAASGGFLGLGKISKEERAVLDEIEAALS